VNEQSAHPVGGVDYPRTLQEFDTWFASEKACVDYVMRLRWADGFCCPACDEAKAWTTGRGLLRCAHCHRQTSAIAGTIFEGTRKPLRSWFQAMWFVTSQKSGGSALGLQRVLGLGSYQTAWTWLHKLRRAMVRPGRDRLSGAVEVDEIYVGGPEAGVHGRETDRKAIVAVAAEIDGNGIGRIRLHCVLDVSADDLLPFVQSVVQPGSEVHTDGWAGYGGLSALGYKHEVTNIKRSGRLAHELLPRVHRVASLLKRWLLGTHQGRVSGEHLEYYLDEFTFRFNRRRSRSRGLLFYRLLQQAVHADPMPYRRVVGGTRKGRHNM
jgi:transposase-like protein